ncbi:hypothetical protein LTR62_006955 [Meristemomyces frigidus]|uniref:DUF2423 domain-containing protein n=1 Tax=Meristemomyces frigidus TaxID=1508187 RepID=A0AAN7TB84_9PEZI|nr:hypothetical protein LTR62_006955 [Meristemomyces frigidus]
MAKSARSSAIKKNNTQLKKRVFGPAVAARQNRLNAKLMALASQPKPPKAEIEVEVEENEQPSVADTSKMDIEHEGTTARTKGDDKPNSRSASRGQKMRHRRNRNDIVFKPTGIAKAKALARKQAKKPKNSKR